MSRPRILVVEDEDLIRDVMVELLTEAGFSVDQAANGEEAIPLLDADGYSLLLTDVHMPGNIDGMQLAERTRKREPGVEIMFVTAQPHVLDRMLQEGFVATTLSKPYNLAELVKVVQRLLRQ